MKYLLKPKYNAQDNIQKMIDEVAPLFGSPYDDINEFQNNKVYLRCFKKSWHVVI